MDYKDKVILITGGSGSFGSNFIRFFLTKNSPKRIRLYSRCEHKQAKLLENPYYGGILDGFIGDVRDKDRLRRAMEGVDVVIHAAALKRVQSCEYNPFETVKTNIMGSMNVIDCALDAGVEKVLVISTDKAVAPLNLYGATKMCMEKLVINANNYRGKKQTKLSLVRYGNVAGAIGTVIPLWRECIREGRTVPITNAQATRFWMDMEVAVEFVEDCLNMMDFLSGGEVFIPKIPSANLMDMFHALGDNHDFSIVGDRVGDKLHETLILNEEMAHTFDVGDKYIISPENPQWSYVKPKGVPCGNRLSYASNTNPWFLTVDEIKKRMAQIA